MNTSKSVLLVEDNEHDQLFFIRALSEIENATLYDIANNGKEAHDKLENPVILPDHIFLDLNMPVMDGIECLTEIIKKPQTKTYNNYHSFKRYKASRTYTPTWSKSVY